MGNIVSTTYGEFKRSLDEELNKVAEGFVKIGYLLKVARDTDVLKESGYNSVAEFAQAEYNLSKDIVSRYIAINDRYSEDGYSECLQEKYKAYGVAKLAEMLTLPDSVIEAISPELTRKEIQEIKKEIKEEEQITDMEVLMEGEKREQQELDNNMKKLFHQYFFENRDIYVQIWKAVNCKDSEQIIIEKILDAFAPSGIAVTMVRIQGIGKFMLSVRGADNELELLNIRCNEKETYSWVSTIEILNGFCWPDQEPQKMWEGIYGEPFKKEKATEVINRDYDKEPQKNEEKKVEVAPVQQNVEKVEETVEPEEQIPGQKEISEYPEYMPGNCEPQTIPQNAQEIVVEPTIYKKGEPRGPITHHIKCSAMFFADAAAGLKNFELRYNDRDYRVGDTLHMVEHKDGHNTGRYIEQDIIYMLEEFTGLKDDYCILGTKLISENEVDVED